MKIGKNTVVRLYCRVTDQDGDVVLSGSEPISYLHGGYDNIFPKLEEALEEKNVGDAIQLILEPKDAFGEYDAALVNFESLSSFQTPPRQGDLLEGTPENGAESVIFRVKEVSSDRVLLDGNHSLAGIALICSVTVSEIRSATTQEIAAKSKKKREAVWFAEESN